MATGAFPLVCFIQFNFPVKPAFMTIIKFRIELGVADTVVNVFDHRQNRRHIMRHVRNFGVADAAAGRFILKFRFEGKFIKHVDRLADVHMITVRIIPLIRNILNVSETGAVLLAKTMGQAFCRRAVESKADIRFFTPLPDMLVEIIHNAVSEGLSFRSRVGNALREECRFIPI